MIATEAVTDDPSQWTFWNTLGVAQFLSEDIDGAVQSLEFSNRKPMGKNGANALFQALAHLKEGRS